MQPIAPAQFCWFQQFCSFWAKLGCRACEIVCQRLVKKVPLKQSRDAQFWEKMGFIKKRSSVKCPASVPGGEDFQHAAVATKVRKGDDSAQIPCL